ncbi:MAG TPA: hypothetical protein VGL56_02085 [Fimbriimonadaceae bacterium]
MSKTWSGIMLLVLALPAAVFAQNQLSHKAHANTEDSAAPVTEAEARATMLRVQAALSSVAQHPMSFGACTIPDSSKPVTHAEVIEDFGRIYKGAKPFFKFTPRAVWFDPAVLSTKSGSPARPTLELLVKQGFVPRVSLLATSKTDTMSIFDFGDTVGIFVARVADVCHLPSPKWSPNIEKP